MNVLSSIDERRKIERKKEREKSKISELSILLHYFAIYN